MKVALGSNTGLLDARGTGHVLCSLDAKFSAVEFADFCSIADEIVLRDQIVLVGKFDKLPRAHRLAVQPFVDEGVFLLPKEAFPIPDLPNDVRHLRASALAVEQGLTTASIADATYEARRLLGAEAYYGITATPLLRQLQHYGLVKRPYVENSVWDLAGQYQQLTRSALEQRYRNGAFELPRVPIPPIALKAIQESKTFGQVIGHIFELRHRFKALRDTLREIEDRLRAGQLSPADQLELEAAWRHRWETVAAKLGAKSGRMAIARTSWCLLKDGQRIVRAWGSNDAVGFGIAAGETIMNWIGPAVDALGFMQVRPIHTSVANYLATSDQAILASLARIFDADFVRLDADMKTLAYQANSPWRSPMGFPTRLATLNSSVARLPKATA